MSVKFKITDLNSGEVKEIDQITKGSQSAEDSIYWGFGKIVYLGKTEEGKKFYYNRDGDNFMVEIVCEVTLNHSEVLKISEYLCRNIKTICERVGPAWLEYHMFKAILEIKNVDFFKEESVEEAKINES